MRMLYAEGLTSPEIEIAEGGTMLDNKSRYAELRVMLDSNREPIKMEAMKRIINMVARGKDVSELFPAVVKNVAVKNLELKKLVYVYLVRYAEEQQDLALLSISTFQRALKDPNQLIRASALRVLSSIRVAMIAPVMLLAIKDSVRDMSAYVRKVAAHAIPKLYALDPELQPQLLECIDYLLADKRTLVLGSAVHAFEATCPDRFDLLHRHFRALCRALADVDEWGQVVMVGLLTRYARTQFTSPHGDDMSENEEEDDDHPCRGAPTAALLDPDHSLLCMSVKPLLQSRNCAVVMAVSQLLYYIAPHNQLAVVPRALVRLLRGPNEVQYVVLVNIATICAARNGMVNERIFTISKNLFEPFLKSFFVRGSDTIHVKQLKLQILTSLVSDTNAQLVIRELQAYLQMPDLASAAIEAIGRCALQVASVAEPCLTYLINLISSNKETVVCAAVVVLKRLLHVDAPLPLLKHVLRLFEKVKAPTARACVIWLVQTHSDKPEINKLAPDLLRKLAKSFIDEADCVKLQTLNLAVRMWISERAKCDQLIRYVLQLARYDRSYDIRDRCRMLRNFLFNSSDAESGGDSNSENRLPLEIFLSAKPAPSVHSQFSDRERFQLGTLSHLLNQKCAGYTDLPGHPTEAPDPSARRAAHPLAAEEERAIAAGQRPAGSGRRDSSAAVASESDEEEDEEDEDEAEDEEDEDEEEEDEEEDEEETPDAKSSMKPSESDKEESESGSEESEEAESEESEEKEPPKKIILPKKSNSNVLGKKPVEKPTKQKPLTDTENGRPKETAVSHDLVDLLGDIDFGPGPAGSAAAVDAPLSYGTRASGPARYVPTERFRLVSPMNTGGLLVEGRYTRDPSATVIGSSMVGVEMLLSYRNPKISKADVKIEKNNSCELYTTGPLVVDGLREDEPRTQILGVDFGDSGRSASWTLTWMFTTSQIFVFEFAAPFGEQIEPPPESFSAAQFNLQRAQMTGLHQFVERLDAAPKALVDIYRIANCALVDRMDWCFAAQTVSRKDVVLISFDGFDVQPRVTVYCENVTFGVQLCQEIQSAFAVN